MIFMKHRTTRSRHPRVSLVLCEPEQILLSTKPADAVTASFQDAVLLAQFALINFVDNFSRDSFYILPEKSVNIHVEDSSKKTVSIISDVFLIIYLFVRQVAMNFLTPNSVSCLDKHSWEVIKTS